jgi:hypothetical protein
MVMSKSKYNEVEAVVDENITGMFDRVVYQNKSFLNGLPVMIFHLTIQEREMIMIPQMVHDISDTFIVNPWVFVQPMNQGQTSGN